MTKKKKIIIAIISVVVAIPLIWWIVYCQMNSTADTPTDHDDVSWVSEEYNINWFYDNDNTLSYDVVARPLADLKGQVGTIVYNDVTYAIAFDFDYSIYNCYFYVYYINEGKVLANDANTYARFYADYKLHRVKGETHSYETTLTDIIFDDKIDSTHNIFSGVTSLTLLGTKAN